MSLETQMASPSRGMELERSEQICWDDVCVSLGYGNKLGHVTKRAGLVVGWGNSTHIVVLGQTSLHLYKITENKDGKKLTIRYNPPA